MQNILLSGFPLYGLIPILFSLATAFSLFSLIRNASQGKDIQKGIINFLILLVCTAVGYKIYNGF